MAITYKDTVLKSSPVAYWRLGESEGGTAVDEMGNYDGTYVNSPTLEVEGALDTDIDTAVFFTSSSNQYVSMGDVLGFDYDDSFSYEIWFKISASGQLLILSKGLYAGAWTGMALHQEASNDLRFYLTSSYSTNNVLDVKIASSFNDDLWHHCVVTGDGTGTAAGLNWYMDGVSIVFTVTADNLTGNLLNVADFQISGLDGVNYMYNGSVDEVAVYGYALSASQVREHYLVGTGLFDAYPLAVRQCSPLAYWRLGEAATGTAVDEVGNYPGGYVGSVTFSVDGAIAGDEDTACTFADYTQYVNVLDGTLASQLSQGAVAFWGKSATADYSMCMAFYNSSDTNKVGEIGFGASGSVFFYFSDATSSYKGSTVETFADDLWHCFVVQSTGTSYEIYVDGIQLSVVMGEGIDNGTWLNFVGATNRALIASRGLSIQNWVGDLDEVAVYNHPLTLSEIKMQYAVGKYAPGFVREVMRPGPLAYWRLGETVGSIAYDETEQYNANYVNSPLYGEDGAIINDADTACAFIASADQKITPGVPILPTVLGDPFSMSFFINTVSVVDVERILCQYDGTSGRMLVRINGTTDHKIEMFVGADGGIVESSTTVNDDTWHHVVITVGSDNIVDLYVNAVHEDSGTITVGIANADFVIAGDNVTPNHFTGTLDEVAIYPVKLSAWDVSAIHTAATVSTDDTSEISGTVNLDDSPYAATMRCYLASDGSFVAETLSDVIDGSYTFTELLPNTEYYIMAINGAGVRPLVHGPVLGNGA